MAQQEAISVTLLSNNTRRGYLVAFGQLRALKQMLSEKLYIDHSKPANSRFPFTFIPIR